VKARLASGNPHKLVELRRALPGWEIELVGATEFPPEDGSTYEENARGKALHGRLGSPADAWVIGEDSGIEAAGLGGRPGIASARWAGDGVGRMLRELEGVSDRRARYVCVIVALGPDGEEIVARGVLEGAIACGPSGEEGFGYDPIFLPAGEERTVADLGDDWKAASSHRARAAAALAATLRAGETGSSRSPATRSEGAGRTRAGCGRESARAESRSSRDAGVSAEARHQADSW